MTMERQGAQMAATNHFTRYRFDIANVASIVQSHMQHAPLHKLGQCVHSCYISEFIVLLLVSTYENVH